MKVAREVSEKLILLSAINDNDIKVIINSQGGHVEAGDTIHDMLRLREAEGQNPRAPAGWPARAP